MKRIVFFAVVVATALCVGCGRRNTANTTQEQTSTHTLETHEGHEAHDQESEAVHAGHNHSNDAEHDNHDANDHESEAAHEGHNHESEESSHEGHGHENEAAEPAASDEIVFTPAQAARTEFEVQPVSSGSFREVIKCYGTVEAASGELTVIAAPVAGVATLADGRIMANAEINKGQTLFRLSSGGLASGDAVTKARIAYDLAKADFDRVSGLYADKLVTNREYLAAQAEYLRAKAEYDPVSRSDGKAGMAIESPADGYIADVMVSSGDYVEMGQPLASVARYGRMELKALVSQRYFGRLQDIDDANFTVPTSGATYTVSSLNGELYSVGRMVQQGSLLIPVVFGFDRGAAIPDGAYVEVSLLGRQCEGVITLPLTAITEQQGIYYVYVQLDEECYSRREVKLGADDGLRVEILSGIGQGERVVTKGAVNVKMASASGSIPHGHAH